MVSNDFRSNCHQLGLRLLKDLSGVKTEEDWKKMINERPYPFPFKFGDCWKQTMEYRVDDFTAEIGFFTDIMGFSPNALGDSYAMFTSPGQEFFFSIVPAGSGAKATPPDTIALEFMVEDIGEACQTLKTRGIEFEREIMPYSKSAPLHFNVLHSPNGVPIRLWGMVEVGKELPREN